MRETRGGHQASVAVDLFCRNKEKKRGGKGMIEKFGVFVPFLSVQLHEYYYLLLVLILSCVLGLVPARRAYKDSLTDGLNIKL